MDDLFNKDFHPTDIANLLGLIPHSIEQRQFMRLFYPPRKKKQAYDPIVYRKEFQDWFREGLRVCRNHPYPYVWHTITAGEKCKRCA